MRRWESPNGPKASSRAWLMCGVIAVHLLCYFSVNHINRRRPAADFFDLSFTLDHWIPYLGWTWPFYYMGVPYMSFWAFWVMWRLPEDRFRSSLRAYLGMIIAGAATQLTIPARSPWPAVPVAFQDFMHLHVSYDPYVCLPSMHVALSVLPACLSVHAFRSPSDQGVIALARRIDLRLDAHNEGTLLRGHGRGVVSRAGGVPSHWMPVDPLPLTPRSLSLPQDPVSQPCSSSAFIEER